MLTHLLFLASTTLPRPLPKPLQAPQATIRQRYEQKAQACIVDLAKMQPMPTLMLDGVAIEVEPSPQFNRRLTECGKVMEILLQLTPEPFKKK